MDMILRHNRAKLVKKYRENERLFPDGIDTMDDPWYRDGSDWPEASVEEWSSERWLEDQIRNVTRVTSGVTQGVTQGVTHGKPDDRKRVQARERMARMRAKRLLAAANPKEAKG